jgi:hypothetical protein
MAMESTIFWKVTAILVGAYSLHFQDWSVSQAMKQANSLLAWLTSTVQQEYH